MMETLIVFGDKHVPHLLAAGIQSHRPCWTQDPNSAGEPTIHDKSHAIYRTADLGTALVFAGKDSTQCAERALFIATGAARSQFAAQLFKCHTLHNHPARSGKGRKEKTLAAKECRLYSAGKLNIVVHGFIKSDNASGVNLEHFTRFKRKFDEVAATVNKNCSRATELF